MIIDIAFNYSSTQYKGIYNGKKKHEPDVIKVLERSKIANVFPIFIGSEYRSSVECLAAAKTHNTFCTIGIHPNDATSHKEDLNSLIELYYNIMNGKIDFESKDFLPYVAGKSKNHPGKNNSASFFTNDSKQLFSIEENKNDAMNYNLQNSSHDQLKNDRGIMQPNTIQFFNKSLSTNLLAIGECGLDYYRDSSTKQDQKHIFSQLLELNHTHYLLHNRESFRDFSEMISDYNIKGVLHSFDGTIEEAQYLIKKGLYIGINGCSLKNQKNVEVVEELDLHHILIESDAPYCRIAKSYAGHNYLKDFIIESYSSKKYKEDMVMKYRNEPITVYEIVEAIANIKNITFEHAKKTFLENTITCFGSTLENAIGN
ncbi:hypothetical protein EDEG_02245 [Edhazardia aedis USNM 41457]|uniref:TatD family hydrolase n=1 Tax=Edhazardia aedis (strain USNM 41457) TaxID=1003232 RepID=J9DLF6_EDHAE|nr:hypothetical protein EDEG_02245 [Edhazardia aedis USNM 41457]|eukprot:EJW03425.1 hypothetical protein EDEG_02245 [Edhazardia aedis USNM 41457]